MDRCPVRSRYTTAICGFPGPEDSRATAMDEWRASATGQVSAQENRPDWCTEHLALGENGITGNIRQAALERYSHSIGKQNEQVRLRADGGRHLRDPVRQGLLEDQAEGRLQHGLPQV